MFEALKKALGLMGAPCDDQTVNKYQKYMEGVLDWNEKVNLTNITNPEEFVVKHFIDSIICVDYPEFEEAGKIIDVGTGGGFPGVPLAIAAPDKEFVLMDSLNKRLKIIDELCGQIGIGNVTTVHARAEELAKNKGHREQYDLCVSRAVANMATLAEYCLPFIKVGGCLMAYKGPDAEKEVEEARKALYLLGGQVEEIREGNLKEFGIDHKVVIIKKVKNTPSKFPRKAGTPAKEPLK
ncbi:MAG: 16S rRNA (guanine(527)-N(7))-methyltransferase RsmG [Firmicutes bacterium]|nr:16S rRNA (guanine(527)-N(7))-methyltransferase RsmG [Bacillota bacterium]